MLDVVYIIGKEEKDDLTLIYSNDVLKSSNKGLDKKYFDTTPKEKIHSRMKNYNALQVPSSLSDVLRWSKPFR